MDQLLVVLVLIDINSIAWETVKHIEKLVIFERVTFQSKP